MRKLIPTLLASAVAGACALTAAGTALAAEPADAAAAPHAGRQAEFMQRLFDKIDTNHDGSISRAEYQAWVDQRFAKLDASGTGSVDAQEIANSPVTAKRVEKRAERIVRRYDRSGSGKFDKADFEAVEMARFDRLSGGADTVTQTQFTAALQHRMHGRGAKPAADEQKQ